MCPLYASPAPKAAGAYAMFFEYYLTKISLC